MAEHPDYKYRPRRKQKSKKHIASSSLTGTISSIHGTSCSSIPVGKSLPVSGFHTNALSGSTFQNSVSSPSDKSPVLNHFVNQNTSTGK